jgi:hypothetical protein
VLPPQSSQYRSPRADHSLQDTGIFDEGRYFDVFAEYAKAEPDGIHASRAR